MPDVKREGAVLDDLFLEIEHAEDLAFRASRAAGANVATSHSLARATVAAELSGHSNVGFSHLFDYLASFEQGRINRDPAPVRTRPFPAFLASDADNGIAQLGFDLAFDEIVETTRTLGIAIFTQKNSYPVGELGYYVRRLANSGLVSIAAANGDAWMAAKAGSPRVYGTNPLAFACPTGDGNPPLVIDQASSATAYVNIADAARNGQGIPREWALDENGQATENAQAALAGALLPFGGTKGANIALMVEMLSAGVSGGSWSMDAPRFNEGQHSPAIGLTAIAVAADNGSGSVERFREHLDRLAAHGAYIPGRGTMHRGVYLKHDIFSKAARYAEGGRTYE